MQPLGFRVEAVAIAGTCRTVRPEEHQTSSTPRAQVLGRRPMEQQDKRGAEWQDSREEGGRPPHPAGWRRKRLSRQKGGGGRYCPPRRQAKLTSAPRAEIAGSSPFDWMKSLHSRLVAAVISSPDQDTAIQEPSLLNPGQEPKRSKYLRGHSVVYVGGLTTLKLIFRSWLQKFQHHKPTYVDKTATKGRP
jgi:hypothetical protein